MMMPSLNQRVSSSCRGRALAMHSSVVWCEVLLMTSVSCGLIMISGAISFRSSDGTTFSLMNALFSSRPSCVFIALALVLDKETNNNVTIVRNFMFLFFIVGVLYFCICAYVCFIFDIDYCWFSL